MTPRTLLSAAVCGFVLLGCASNVPRLDSSRDCNYPDCRIAVSAIATPSPVGGCSVSVDAATLYIKSKGTSNIFWDLDVGSANNGYSFAANGIVFDDPQGEFDCQVVSSGKSFKCSNKHSKAGDYKYTVNVVRGSTSCIPLDPMIIND